MNISQPVASVVESVEFQLLSSEEIKSISVKRINNETTFDSLLNPVPGGLYDPALGSWGDALCTTCNLGQSLCPGHAGHIELPVPVYHPVFMDHAYRFIRAQCVFCHGFRISRREVHRFTCMFRLLQYGLQEEASMIDAIGEKQVHPSLALVGVPVEEELLASDDEDNNSDNVGEDASYDNIMRARDAYVNRALQHYTATLGELRRSKHEGAWEMRKQLSKEFFSAILPNGRKCVRCTGESPSYRKDRFVKIFEKTATMKANRNNGLSGRKAQDAVVLLDKPASQGNGSDHQHDLIDDGVSDSSGQDDEGEGTEIDENGAPIIRANDADQQQSKSSSAQPSQRYLTPLEVLERLRLLFRQESDVLSLVYESRPRHRKSAKWDADMFFLRTILIPPNRYRPEARMGEAQVSEAPQNSLYKQILRASAKLSDIYREVSDAKSSSDDQTMRRQRNATALYEAWAELQNCVNSLIDRNKNPIQGAAGKRNEDGIKQKLEKKEGLFRKNMMGKRVNYAARSVISPDPNIETNEIGVPPVFAVKLTYPEPVTSHNFKDMQQAVINGISKWPGAAAIENENGQIVNLRNKSADERLSLANQLLAPAPGSQFPGMRNKKVHRHLTNGDVVLMNRQPTLHKPSIMGHRVRVLPGEKTIRMHYANCNTYNADFDGDEMNMHFPQNEIARAEALQLADTDHQYISGTQGKPLRGLIQDHLSVSVALCSKDTFLDRASYQQLIYSALRPESGHIIGEKLELLPPAILKPVARWTGKQVITTILKNIRPLNCGDLWMKSKSQVKGPAWGVGHEEEGDVVFRDGEFISGILDKSQLGPSSGGFIHSVHEVYGAAIAGKLLSSMGRLLTRYLGMRAFTCGMDDLRLTPTGEAVRRERIANAQHIGLKVASKYVSLDDKRPDDTDPHLLQKLEEVMRDDSKQEGLDLLVNQACGELSGDITRACLPVGLEKQFPQNHMQSMTTSGAKGGPVNANLISCNLGQQILEGRRVPLMVSGKSLPSFKPFDTNVRAGGYIVNRFLTGIRPQEYYFHHMAGREGLIDTAVKTSRSGYLQRCLIKGMEGLGISYDFSVRDADGSVVQFLYGEDGVDISKQKFLTDFGFLLQNRDSQLSQIRLTDIATHSLFDQRDSVLKEMKSSIKAYRPGKVDKDPVLSRYNPSTTGFATSERFFNEMTAYIKTNPDGLIREKSGSSGVSKLPGLARKTAEKIFAAKYLRSLTEPGEAVGVVAGQSVGEPSTQMTLNTFHLAGHSAKNVTLGIPRLREILMTASSRISTPTMTMVLNEELSHQDGENFAKSISVLPLADLIDKVIVREGVGKGVANAVARKFKVSLKLFPSAEYTSTYAVQVAEVLDALEKKFVPTLCSLVNKEIGRRRDGAGDDGAAAPEIGVGIKATEISAPATAAGSNRRADNDAGVEDDDDDNEDDDATGAKQKANRSEAVSYGPNDDEDDAIQAQASYGAEDFVNENAGQELGTGDSGGQAEGSDDEDEELDQKGLERKREEASAKEEAHRDFERQEALKRREQRVMESNKGVIGFQCDEKSGAWSELVLEFDAATPKILMLNIVQQAVAKTSIHQVPGIGSCTFVEDEKMKDVQSGKEIKIPVVHTEGINLRAAQELGASIDPDRIATNDIAAVLATYGVEACRNNIIRELDSVFSGHGIGVDNRHLNLIGDYMTRNGGFTPFNRMGLSGNVSPFTKMSFETTVAFLKDAVAQGDWDPLATPSSRLVMGRLGKSGTGSFDVLTSLP